MICELDHLDEQSASRSVQQFMKHALLSLALALVSPFVFAQTNPGNEETENPVVPNVEATTTSTDGPGNGETENPVTPKTEAATTTTTDGSVSAYALDEMIAVITSEGGESINFVIGTAAKYQDKAGNDIDASAIKEGIKVQVTAEENGDQMVASRIVIDS
jgi:hypothetical protein